MSTLNVFGLFADDDIDFEYIQGATFVTTIGSNSNFKNNAVAIGYEPPKPKAQEEQNNTNKK